MSILDESTPLIREQHCWAWLGGKVNSGYGKISVRAKRNRKGEKHKRVLSRLAHVIAYITFKEKMPWKKQVHHLCYNRLCVNPAHLYCLTGRQNRADALRRKMLE